MGIIFTEEQERTIQAAVDWFFNSSEQVFEISGGAGTGKSVVINEIIKRLKLNFYEYLAAAYTGAAAIVMRTKGLINAQSLHSIFYYLEKIEDDYDDPYEKVNTKFNTKKERFIFVPVPVGGISDDIKLIVIDEGYMVPKNMRYHILKHGIKVLVCGDAQQLPPIGDDPAFLTGSNIHWLTQVMRQNQNNPIVYLAQRAIKGEPIHCGRYGNNAVVIEEPDFTTEMALKIGNIICGTNNTRDKFNNIIRSLLGRRSTTPEYGDRVICRKNNWERSIDNIALANGLQGYIVSPVDATKFCFKNKNIFSMDFLPDLLPYPFQDLQVNYPYIKSDHKNREIIKNDKHTKGELFEYAYAITTHISQGSEYQAGIFFEEYLRPDIQNSLTYTGITRFRNFLIYVKRARKFY